MKTILAVVILTILSTLSFAQDSSVKPVQPAAQPAADLANAPFRNPALPLEDRVNDLVSRMTLEEKVSQMVHTAAAIPRLGIPQYNWWSEGLHGAAREGYATVFPQAIGLAATFDPDLLRKDADATASEFRAKYEERVQHLGYSDWFHGLTVWSPNINIFRDPRWGRGQETYGEDPFLTAKMGVAYVTGLQGDDPKYLKALSTPKHFAVHSGPEPTRHTVDVTVSAHDLEDTYLPAFRATIGAGAGSTMCAYNSVDGKPACAQPLLLQEHLRDAWHFQGYVVSDCGAASDIQTGHHYAKTMEEGVAAGVKAGMDIICGIPMPAVTVERDALLTAVRQGLLSEKDIDQSVKRLFTARMKLGMFDPPNAVPYAKTPLSEIDSEPHRVLALQTARESLVLLKNTDHLLPLGMKYEHIAVIGPNADSVDPLLGNYNGTPSHPVTVLDGIRTKFEGVSYVAGSSLTGPSLTPIIKGFLTNKSPMEGLVGAYFKGTELQGTPAFTRIDPRVNFAWRDGAGRGLTENFSVRWTGTLLPPTTGDYQIGFTGTDAFHFWLDDQLIGESWYSDTAKTRLKTIHLEAGHSYAVKIECSQEGASGMARLVWHVPGDWDQKELAKVVKQADLIIAVLGLAGELEGEEMPIKIDGFSGGDRTSLNLPAAQEQLLKDLVASGKPVVVVLMNGSALAVNWADSHVAAILEAWYPGEEGGTAVAEALAGDFSPGGRLPLTFYKSVDQMPAFEDYSMKGRTYRYFTGEPLYLFGYGLSYTTFEYRNLSFDKTSLDANDNLTAKVDVKNTGKLAGDEVVEVYVSHPGVDGAPIRALAGFKRVHVEPGATNHVEITVPNRQLSVVEADGTRKIVPGDLQVWVGGGQPGTHDGMATAGVAGSVKITGEAILPK